MLSLKSHYQYKQSSSVPVDYTAGNVYNLQKIYEDLNDKLFQGSLKLKIGWFGRQKSRTGNSLVLGCFHEEEQLVRIHRSLDRRDVPLFFVEYVIYHEIIHSLVPREYSSSGRTMFHGKKFKEYERRFPMYEHAIAWEKENAFLLLRGYKLVGKEDGRT
ncbi:SprT-like domain-containing protein [Chlamydia ibidis]|nr:SprT-like domain-containing protein [Chlamydia ibidis]